MKSDCRPILAAAAFLVIISLSFAGDVTLAAQSDPQSPPNTTSSSLDPSYQTKPGDPNYARDADLAQSGDPHFDPVKGKTTGEGPWVPRMPMAKPAGRYL